MTDELLALSTIRDYTTEDKAFVMATFLRGLYYGDSWFSTVDKNAFMTNYKHMLGVLLEHPNVMVKVCCLKDDPTVILGYSILSADFQVIHWVFVKKSWRNQGIARALVPQRPVAVTHLTALGKILLSKFENCIFNPFQL